MTAAKFNWGLFSPKALVSLDESDARINIWDGAVRSSKTVTSIVRWLEYMAMGPPGALLMAGKTERTLKRNILDPIEQMAGSKFCYNRGTGEARYYGRLIYISGANDARSEGKIRGLTLAGAYGDELSLWPESYFKMLLSRLSVQGAQLFGTTNPDSPYHWLKKDYLDRPGLNLKQWHFTLDDNPNLGRAYIDDLKREYTGLWHKRFIDGLWVMAEGAVYDMFDDSRHCISEADLPDRWDQLYLGVDYGTGNPTVFLLLAQVGQLLYVIDEYYWDSSKKGRQKTDMEYSADLQVFIGERWPRAIVIDPSAASFKLQLRRDGMGQTKEANNAVLDGIRTVATHLASGRLFICRERCPNLVKEFTSYVWDPKAQERGEDKPIKQNDHALDALRYILHTLFRRQAIGVIGKPAGY